MANNATTQTINRQIKGEIYDSLRTALVKPQGKSKKSWTDSFIEVMLKEAKENPAGPLGQLISRQLLQDDIISSLDEQTEKLLARDQDFLRYRVLKQLFSEQRDVLMDDKIRRKCLCTSRRAGKTNTLARLLVYTCITPNSPCIYIAVKFDNAIKQCFDLCVESAKECELSIETSSKNDGSIVFSNGSSIMFRGNSNKAEADKLRGNKFRLACVDEAAFQINMNYLINDILTPCLMDYDDSVLVLASTPAVVPHTFFQKAFDGKEYKNYIWSLVDNPFIPNPEEEIQRIADSKGIPLDSSFILRELRGLWYFDTEAQVFKGRTTYIVPSNLAELNFTNICIGVDFGFSDYNAVVSLAYNKNTRQAWVIRENKFNHADISTIVSVIKEHDEAAKAALLEKGMEPEVDVFCDNNEKSIIAELKRNYGVRAYPAWKHDKAMAIEQLAEELRTGRMNIPLHGALDDEMDSILYKRDEGTDAILPELDEDLGVHPDIMMALLYASRQYFHELGIEAGGESKEKKEER